MSKKVNISNDLKNLITDFFITPIRNIIGSLSNLKTDNKENVVSAINDICDDVGYSVAKANYINDGTPRSSITFPYKSKSGNVYMLSYDNGGALFSVYEGGEHVQMIRGHYTIEFNSTTPCNPGITNLAVNSTVWSREVGTCDGTARYSMRETTHTTGNTPYADAVVFSNGHSMTNHSCEYVAIRETSVRWRIHGWFSGGGACSMSEFNCECTAMSPTAIPCVYSRGVTFSNVKTARSILEIFEYDETENIFDKLEAENSTEEQ